MKSKLLILILPILFYMNGCNDYKNEVLFEYVDPLKKVFPESSYFPPMLAHADVARGEYATFQFIIRSGLSLKNVQIETQTPFLNGVTLGEVKTGFIGYVPVDRPTPNPGRDYLKTASGYYPDPILDDSSVDIAPAMTQAIWTKRHF